MQIIPEVIDIPPRYPLDLTYKTIRTFPGMRLTAGETRYSGRDQVQQGRPGTAGETRYSRGDQVQRERPGTVGETRYSRGDQVLQGRPGTAGETRMCIYG